MQNIQKMHQDKKFTLQNKIKIRQEIKCDAKIFNKNARTKKFYSWPQNIYAKP